MNEKRQSCLMYAFEDLHASVNDLEYEILKDPSIRERVLAKYPFNKPVAFEDLSQAILDWAEAAKVDK